MLRTHTCGEVNEKLEGKEIILAGWAKTIRIHGNVAFIDLRDRYSIVQCVISKKDSKDFEKIKNLSVESCIQIIGKVALRPEKLINPKISSGKIELKIKELNIFTQCAELPFEIEKKEVNEDLRLKYRYLDIRSERMTKNLELRNKIINFMRNYLNEKDFLEITTPLLTKSTPEGARDFIVPSRIHQGKFYALPQSPQQYKQLLMVGGIDKYFQIAPCFRDEDARADRSPGEFYQLDLEMSFVNQEQILNLVEDLILKIIKEILPEKELTFKKFPRLDYDEAMKKYKTDKPDLRKDKNNPNELAFAWIINFPLFEEEKSKGHYAPMHHMFTQPKEEYLKYLNKKDAHKVKSYQHDLILNGFEVGGGSIRIHNPEIQEKVFDLIGFSKEQKKYFEHILNAFKFGVPPHGGIAPGIDRLIMVLLGEPNLREVIAFPKNREGKDVTMDAPSTVEKNQLKEVNIKLDLDNKKPIKKRE